MREEGGGGGGGGGHTSTLHVHWPTEVLVMA